MVDRYPSGKGPGWEELKDITWTGEGAFIIVTNDDPFKMKAENSLPGVLSRAVSLDVSTVKLERRVEYIFATAVVRGSISHHSETKESLSLTTQYEGMKRWLRQIHRLREVSTRSLQKVVDRYADGDSEDDLAIGGDKALAAG
jgi:hypothetical protein